MLLVILVHLTKFEKKLTLERSMIKSLCETKIVPMCLGWLLLALFITGCGAPYQRSQLDFGIQAAATNMWDEAIFRWQKVIQEFPSSAAAHNNLAVAYEKKGLFEEAKKEYELAIELQPDNEYIQSNWTKFQKNYEQVLMIQERRNEGKDENIP